MRCLRCGTDSWFRERAEKGKWCAGCGRRFVFEPRSAAERGMTDARFRRAINVVSRDGTVRWGLEHLHYQLRRSARRHNPIVGTLFPKALLPDEPARVGRWWTSWTSEHGKAAGFLDPAPRYRASGPLDLPPDVPDYAFDRIVVCDRDRTADVLLANRFHVEHACPVVSSNGYPPRVFETVMTMVAAAAGVTVWALHDADAPGCALPGRLAGEERWFARQVAAGDARVVDAGLRPRAARRFRVERLPGDRVARPAPGIDAGELRWLRRHRVEVAAVPPGILVARMGRLVSGEPALERRQDPDDGPVWWDLEPRGDGDGEDLAAVGEDVG